MTNTAKQTDIDLLDLLAVIWRQKWIVFGVMTAFIIVSAAYAWLAPRIYATEVVLAPARSESGLGLPSGIGGLASLAGINLGSGSDREEKVAALRSRAFVEEFITENNLLPVLFADEWDAGAGRWIGSDPEDWPDIREGVEYFIDDLRSVDEDNRTGLVTLTVRWSDPRTSTAWAEDLVERINERLRVRDLENSERKLKLLYSELEKANLVELRQAISSVIENEIQKKAIAQAESEYAFKVVDPPRAPRKPSWPKKAIVLALGALAGGLVGVIVALVRWTATKDRERVLDEGRSLGSTA